MNFKIIGVGAEVGSNFVDHTSALGKSINLFPLRVDNKSWLNHTVTMNGQRENFNLFQNSAINSFGIKVKDSQCMNKLAAMFRSTQRTLVVPLENSNHNGGHHSKLSLLGEIFLLDLPPAGPTRQKLN